LAVPQSERLVLQNPPPIIMDFRVVPSSPITIAHEYDSGLLEHRRIVLDILSLYVLSELDAPYGVNGLIRPPWASGEIVLDDVGGRK